MKILPQIFIGSEVFRKPSKQKTYHSQDWLNRRTDFSVSTTAIVKQLPSCKVTPKENHF
ncbi:hypothetical protein [Caudoviricetes sp.]|nr:hypothetical protein [Caudoviricetes sp.]